MRHQSKKNEWGRMSVGHEQQTGADLVDESALMAPQLPKRAKK